jgi:colicin import membrane protein
MGKKSLIKSTTKKNSDTKKVGDKTTKKTAAQATKKTPAKAAAKAKPKAEPKAAGPAKPTAKSKPAPKKLSIKELLFRKFEALQPAAPKIPAPKPSGGSATAPPLVATSDPDELKRLRMLLNKRFDMAEIKTAAKPLVPHPAQEKEPVAQAATATAKVKPATDKAKDVAAAQPKAAKPVTKPSEESAYITIEPPKTKPQADPVGRSVKWAAIVAGLLILMLLAVSANNSSKYYIKPKDDAIEIWKGAFSPKRNEFFMVLHGIRATEPIKPVYSKKEIFPMIFKYYVEKSDTLLEVKGLPDFEGIKKYLHQAEAYAVTGEMKTAVNERLNTIERMILLYKAEVAISRNTVDSLQSAIKILKEAGQLTSSTIQSEEIEQKIAATREGIKALKGGTAATQPEK